MKKILKNFLTNKNGSVLEYLIILFTVAFIILGGEVTITIILFKHHHIFWGWAMIIFSIVANGTIFNLKTKR